MDRVSTRIPRNGLAVRDEIFYRTRIIFRPLRDLVKRANISTNIMSLWDMSNFHRGFKFSRPVKLLRVSELRGKMDFKLTIMSLRVYTSNAFHAKAAKTNSLRPQNPSFANLCAFASLCKMYSSK